VYLRGEIAQGIFLNFKNVLDTMRVKIPFGIAQQGKAFRNEITMGQSIFRTLEFDLMEFEYFIREEEWTEKFNYWKDELWKFSQLIGIDKSKLRWRDHEEAERAHYSKGTVDLEYKFPFGFKEMWAVAYRTDFDLTNHSNHSKEDLSYRDPKTNEKFIPHVVEPTFGMSRGVLVLLVDSYREEEVNGKTRTYLKLDPKIAPVKAAVFPLQKDDKLRGKARELYETLRASFVTEFDDAGNIGKMYRRQDEIGTPYCITVDYQTLEDHTVTVRERDTMSQSRMPIDTVLPFIQEKLKW
ncbi:glycine--tRNA ligase, partial [Candidatus Woesebacteria bacterium]|nr:glycine--tRNA ligase [Candidatus Woesebacteria bacterium]